MKEGRIDNNREMFALVSILSYDNSDDDFKEDSFFGLHNSMITQEEEYYDDSLVDFSGSLEAAMLAAKAAILRTAMTLAMESVESTR